MESEPTAPLPITEEENSRTSNLSELSVVEILRVMNEEDALVAVAVGRVLGAITKAVEGTVAHLKAGGRLFYIGTGTSGRLGVLDAAECPPTFGVSSELVQGVIAGGYDACHRAVEASEDDEAAGIADLKGRGFSSQDVLVGIAASGRTPYTVGAVQYARSLNALTVALTCVPDSPLTRVAEISVVPIVGPEVVTGSTRLKAGTAQKLVLNMLSTATLVKLGYVSGNRMSNLQPRNEKLRSRALRILRRETGLSEARAEALLAAAGDLSVALVSAKAGRTVDESRQALAATRGVVNEAIKVLSAGS
ncbi:MAG TPA: N-acetylmuramic acid 6-phosphate etherase [Pyrinomonadaceae bacterium]|nr:N-acetylmuramic acid 6-phosphate etherase [Pyrinomonadaceae bacterium]